MVAETGILIMLTQPEVVFLTSAKAHHKLAKEGVINVSVANPPGKTGPPAAIAYQSTVVPFSTPLTLSSTSPIPHLLPFTATK